MTRGLNGRLLRIVLSGLLTSGAALAETPNRAVGFHPDGVYDVLGLDSVSKFNGNLTIAVPIGITYPVGDRLSYGITLVYNANGWRYCDRGVDYFIDPTTGQCQEWVNSENGTTCKQMYFSYTEPDLSSNAGFGWALSLGRIVRGATDGAGWAYESPDGDRHQFFSELSAQGPVYDPDVFYTIDGSYLRQRRYSDRRVIEFPDGSIHTFRQIDGSEAAEFLLTEMRDRWGNTVTVAVESQAEMSDLSPSDRAQYSSRWVVTDRHQRKHRMYFKPGGYYDEIVARIELDGFGGVAGAFDAADAVYEFSYENATLVRPCGQTPSATNLDVLWEPTVSSTVTVPVLTRVMLPDGTSYSVAQTDYERGGQVLNDDIWRRQACGYGGDVGVSGTITGLTLPTGGRVEWAWDRLDFPAQSGDAVFFTKTDAVTSRRLRDAASLRGTWSYVYAPNDAWGDLVTTARRPDGTSESHYFWTGTTTSGGTDPEYGLPFSMAARPENRYGGSGLFISSLVMNSEASDPGNAERLDFVQYEGDGPVESGVRAVWPDRPRQVVRSRSEYRLDEEMYEYVSRQESDFDGYGHYRMTRVEGDVGGVLVTRDSTRRWNPSRGTYGQPSFDPIDPGEAWLPEVYDFEEEVEGSSIARKEAAFGFFGELRATRTYAGTSRGPADVIVRFTRNAEGEVERESYYGGDGANLSTTLPIGDLAFPFPACADYALLHAYSGGALATSRWHERPVCGASQPSSIATVDRTIDPSTGLASKERDSSGVETVYAFDALGRITGIDAPSGAETRYTYEAVTPQNQTPRVRAETTGIGGQVLQQSTFAYDAFGRLALQSTTQPDGAIAHVETRYDANGRTSARSEQELTPMHFTLFGDFDALDRPRLITGPDGSMTTLQYAGKGVVRRTRTFSSPSGDAPATVEETYDALGRLVRLTDGDGSPTSYAYDVAGRLAAVSMAAGSVTQSRRFLYDALGFLRAECHPETGNGPCSFTPSTYPTPAGTTTSPATGDIVYGEYDARGNPGARIVRAAPLQGYDGVSGGSYDAFDEFYTYDEAGRMIAIQTRNPYGCGYYPPGTTSCQPEMYRPFKQFTYASENVAVTEGTSFQKGKLVAATRSNYDPALYAFRITDRFTYADPAGRISALETEIVKDDGVAAIQTLRTSYSYDELDRISRTTLPGCTDGDGCFVTDEAALTDVSNTIAQGRLASVRGAIRNAQGVEIASTALAPSIVYHPSGMAASVDHGNGVQEIIADDASGMPRPASITFTGAVACAPPVITQQPQSMSVEPDTPVRLTVAATGNGVLHYVWFRGPRGETTAPTGVDAPYLDVAGVTSETRYWVRVTNYCTESPGSSLVSTMATGVGPVAVVATEAASSVASEEAVLTVGVAAPAQLVATAAPASSVLVTWSGSAASYELERMANGEGFTRIATPAASSWTDETVASGMTYVYRVRSVLSGGGTSPYSNVDIATTVGFTDDPLVPSETTIKAAHMSELREAVGALRAVAGLGPAVWTDADLVGVPVRAVHVNELRAAQSEARGALGLGSAPYTGTVGEGTAILAIHLTEIREAAK